MDGQIKLKLNNALRSIMVSEINSLSKMELSTKMAE